ncbi:MAG: 2-hydroxyacyl-CoA dehydratase family protein [Planctomycetota bacterium]|nr:2-hydroxyacyl-CoA dehydratase family protein [Planctomycetota bacterium]
MSAAIGGAVRCLSLAEWDQHYSRLKAGGLREPWYGGPLRRHVDDGGDLRLLKLRFDSSPAALRLWNFLLTEELRLNKAREAGKKIVGTMKDLGTVPVMVYSLPNAVAFYPDGAWWVPCVMELNEGCLAAAAQHGLDESFCPVRAMVGAFVTGTQFPRPDMLVCSVGATCDDFSSIAQRLEALGFPILWWEMPARRHPDPDEEAIALPGGFSAPACQVAVVKTELERICAELETLTGQRLSDGALRAGITAANEVRRVLARLRRLVFCAPRCPLPALELLIAEMLAIHFCSDREEALAVLAELLAETERRAQSGESVLPERAVRVFWVNPVADLAVMNLLEASGGRLCGTDFMFSHALDEIPGELPPLEALARMALADPMAGPARDRAARICRDAAAFGAEAVVVSRIPGASHCALEGGIIAAAVRERLGLPTLEFEVPPVSDALRPTLQTRLEALVETVLERRGKR